MTRLKLLTVLPAILMILALTSCVTFAPPSPMITFGGPQTTEQKTSETALGLGTGGVFFDNTKSFGNGWFGRYKYGLGKKLDLGIDAMSIIYSDKRTFTSKVVARYMLKEDIRIEGGVGLADDSNGKSINGDMGLTCGSINTDRPWNYYFTIRIGMAKGYPGNILSKDNASSDSIAPPNLFIGLINAGTQAAVTKNIKFIFEGGFGYLFPDGHKPGPTYFIMCGMQFNINRKNFPEKN